MKVTLVALVIMIEGALDGYMKILKNLIVNHSVVLSHQILVDMVFQKNMKVIIFLLVMDIVPA